VSDAVFGTYFTTKLTMACASLRFARAPAEGRSEICSNPPSVRLQFPRNPTYNEHGPVPARLLSPAPGRLGIIQI
jgi:hypothetical protein